jgi:hypothetical protein
MGRKHKNRTIDLSNIPKLENGRFDWKNTIGLNVNGNYRGFAFTITIVDYKNYYLYIKYLQYDIYKIYIDNFKKCDLGNLLHIRKRRVKKSPRIYITTNQVKEYLSLYGYTLISEYKNAKTKIIFNDKDGYYYNMLFDTFKRDQSGWKFHHANQYTIQNIILWCKIENKPFELLSTEYVCNNTKLKWRCLKESCGEIFESSLSAIISGEGCGVCCNKQLTETNCLANKFPQIAEEWHPILNGVLTPFDVVYGSNKKVWWKCKKCKHAWMSPIVSRTKNKNPS